MTSYIVWIFLISYAIFMFGFIESGIGHTQKDKVYSNHGRPQTFFQGWGTKMFPEEGKNILFA
jgi:hypothetical protein